MFSNIEAAVLLTNQDYLQSFTEARDTRRIELEHKEQSLIHFIDIEM